MLRKIILFSSMLCASFTIALLNSCPSSASTLNTATQDMFAQNNILFYSCSSKSGLGGSFKMNPAADPWYAEGDYVHNYAGHCGTANIGCNNNSDMFNSIQTDPDMANLQYVYAERWDADWSSWPVKFTSNGSTSTTKYYLIVLPDGVYNVNDGETFLATFENLSEPIHFLLVDVHSCAHQDICNQAAANPNYAGGEGLLGALWDQTAGGSFSDIYKKTGGITALHRLTGEGEPLLKENSSGSSFASGSDGIGCIGDFKYYGQSGESWSSYSFSSCGTIGECGCGPTSFAMMATMLLGEEISPLDTAKVIDSAGLMTGSGSSWEITETLAKHYNLEYQKVDTPSNIDEAINTINQLLTEGWMVHVSNTHHYFGIRQLTADGKWLLADSAGETNSTTPHDPKSVLEGIPNTATDTNVYLNNIHAIRSNAKSCGLGECGELTNSGIGDQDVLKAAEEILQLANANGSTYTRGGGHNSSVFDSMLNGSPINVDCTGLASLIMYKAYGITETFASSTIASNSNYVEVDRADVRPGDVFAYNSPQGHGGIVIEAENGVVTKIIETGGTEGRSGNNDNIGYSGANSYSVSNMNTENGHFFRYREAK